MIVPPRKTPSGNASDSSLSDKAILLAFEQAVKYPNYFTVHPADSGNGCRTLAVAHTSASQPMSFILHLDAQGRLTHADFSFTGLMGSANPQRRHQVMRIEFGEPPSRPAPASLRIQAPGWLQATTTSARDKRPATSPDMGGEHNLEAGRRYLEHLGEQRRQVRERAWVNRGVILTEAQVEAGLLVHLSMPDLVSILSRNGGSLRLQETLKNLRIDLNVVDR